MTDLDDDGDGFPDLIEIAYPSDPRDSNSIPNASPDLDGNAVMLSFLENLQTGSKIGGLSATDADINTTLSFFFTNGVGDAHNSLFALDKNGTIRTSTLFDFELNA